MMRTSEPPHYRIDEIRAPSGSLRELFKKS
jgi:hypothetical protein